MLWAGLAYVILWVSGVLAFKANMVVDFPRMCRQSLRWWIVTLAVIMPVAGAAILWGIADRCLRSGGRWFGRWWRRVSWSVRCRLPSVSEVLGALQGEMRP